MPAKSYLISQVSVVNEGEIRIQDIWICNGIIAAKGDIAPAQLPPHTEHIDGKGKYLLPGGIDAHVHFREPGLTHKGDMATESQAAVAGGITSFLEMPNTLPPTVSTAMLQEKIDLAARHSVANYGFFIGATESNLDEILKTSQPLACGIKLFLGSSTGNMLIANRATVERLFAESPLPIVAHCEDEQIISSNTMQFKKAYPNHDAPPRIHPLIRTAEACYRSTAFAIEIAEKYQTKLHIAHLTTEKELALLSDQPYGVQKRITAEVSPTHLWFCDKDFDTYGNLIKCNPSVKTANDRNALRAALSSGKIDILATDHAPHTLEEKQKPYFDAPSGVPSIQHSLLTLLEMEYRQEITLTRIVEAMSHTPALLFGIQNRGFVRQGYAADLVLIDKEQLCSVTPESLLYKCQWSPLNGQIFHRKILSTWVNGERVYHHDQVVAKGTVQALQYSRA